MTSSAPEGELPLEALVGRSVGAELTPELTELLPALAEDLKEIDARLQEVLGATYPQLTEAARYACQGGGKR
ncbi:MAG: hypothetical protein L3K07_09335, partial [Thermoplasmata archaeon]|nr:hypothetical protein [Thermoplasmata archaeon]